MLSDLDELVLKCRDERARAYIREAIACYKAGAYRSAIVSTWIAVAFDIIDKVYELSHTGDKAAEAFIKEFEAASDDTNPARLLVFERSLLTRARDEFELVSAQEYSELERVRIDRHKCAHPSRASYSEVFTPSAELARLHVRSAVESLLQHEPAQGKAALRVLLRDIHSKYFPIDQKSIAAFLDKSVLKRARPTLVRNLLVVLIKSTLHVDTDAGQRARNRRAMKHMLTMHRDTCLTTLAADLPRLYEGLETDDQLSNGARLLALDPAFSQALNVPQMLRIREFVRHMPPIELWYVDEFLEIPQLIEAVRERIARVSTKEIRDSNFFVLPDAILKHAIDHFLSAHSFEAANDWGKFLRSVADELHVDEVKRVLRDSATNPQVLGSFQLPKLVTALRAHKKLTETEFDELSKALKTSKAADPAKVDVDEWDDSIPF